MKPLLLKVDCHSLPVSNLDEAIEFYESLGHALIWRDDQAAGLRMRESETELVVHTDKRPIETDFVVDSVSEAVKRFKAAGGSVLVEPFEIRIGMCAVLHDPWKNPIVVLDVSKGELEVDETKQVKGNVNL